jgi:hypothetical protein
LDRWLVIRCQGCPKVTLLPARMLAKKLGSPTKLRDVLPRLKCSECGSAPRSVELCEDGGGGPIDRAPGWRLVLSG